MRRGEGWGLRFILAAMLGGGGAVLLVTAWDLWTGSGLLVGLLGRFSPGGRVDFRASFYVRAGMSAATLWAVAGLCLHRLARVERAGGDPQPLLSEYAQGLGLLLVCAGFFGSLQYFRVRLFGTWLWDVVFHEDGVVEYGQLVLLLAALGWTVAALRRHLRQGGPAWASAWLALFAAGLFVAAGEELSWGQRIFGWETGDGLRAINYQGEANVHNLLNREGLNWAYTTLGGLISGGLVALAALRPRLEAWAGMRRLLPDPRWLFLALFFPVVAPLDELMENLLSTLFLLYALRVHGAMAAPLPGRSPGPD